ncbi:GNAT family N-acetyltransferase [Saxibacter everestensis]|uniref:GNAT family N-acetyltransferase n=1 Tax=Saxibacter everestensis TaxID=2909229 RepID=A0ABY8QWZ7_9MICO|nr:GNAT family N-acetyltransferase [Brevibacteriaceae bacterium ZFBP1038]
MQSSHALIRAAEDRDAPRLAEVHVAAWRAAYKDVMSAEYLESLDIERSTSFWRRQISEPRPGVSQLVAETGDGVVGFAIVGPPRDDVAPGTGQLWAINLHPDSWGQGIGSKLFGAAEQLLRRLGYAAGYLWVEQGNDRAIRFYRGRGWPADGASKVDVDTTPPLTENRHSRTFR